MKRMTRTVLALLCLGLASCNQGKLIEKFTPPAEAAVAKSALQNLRQDKLEAIESRLAPSLRNDPTVEATLHQLHGYFPAGEPHAMKTIGAFTNTLNGVKHVRLNYEMQFATGWVQASVRMVEDDGKILIEGLRVNRTAQSLEQLNAFSTQGKGPAAWLMLGLACALPLFSLFAFVLCLRTPMRGRKWLWAIFTLVGVITVHLNWTTGDFSLQLLSIELLSASVMRSPAGAWLLGASFPLGAAIFLLRRRDLMRAPAISSPSALPNSDQRPPKS